MFKQDTVTLQSWLRTVIMSRGYLTQKVSLANRIHQLHENDVVSDEGEASVLARLNVYSSGYMLRLLDCLYADYAISKKFMGDELFDHFAKAYLAYHPSTSFTLYDLGEKFPEFLEKTKPVISKDEDSSAYDIPANLARVERARQVAMRAPGLEDDVTGNTTAEVFQLFTTLNIRIPECLQLLELEMPMKQFFDAILQDKDYELPSRGKTFMAVSRKNFRVTTEEISEMQYLFLQQCKKQANLYDAIKTLGADRQIPAGDLLADAYLWMPYFRKNGFVQVL